MTSHDAYGPTDTAEPDIGFQAGFGFYLGLVATGVAAIVGVIAGVTTATLLGLLPSTLTIVAIGGHLLARRAVGLPERIGRCRRRRLACYLPAVAFAGVVAVAAAGPFEITSRFAAVTAVVVLLTALAGGGLSRLARNRYIDAITGDEPLARWSWHRVGYGTYEWIAIVGSVLAIGGGLVAVVLGNWSGLFWVVYGAFFLLAQTIDGSDWFAIDPRDRWNPPELRVHEAGLVVDGAFTTRVVPWERIDGVWLTDDELTLALDRRWLDIRCDRSTIDDPEAVCEAIKAARGGGRDR